MKKFLSIVISLAVVLSVVTVFPAQNIEAGAVSKRLKAVKAYKKFLNKEKGTWKNFSLVNIDNDNVPELLLKDSSEVFVYLYSKGKVEYSGYRTHLKNEKNGKFNYYKNTGVFHVYQSGFGEWNDSYPKISKGKVKTCYYTAGLLKSNKKSYYKITGNSSPKKISKAKYNKWIKKNIKGKKASQAKFRKNTKTERNKYCK